MALASAASSRAAVINVPADHSTIQAAVDAAASNDTILIAAGVYAEQVLITNKSLTLLGSPGAVLRATPGMNQTLADYGSTDVALLGVALSDVKVSGLVFEGEHLADAQSRWFDGICYVGSSGSIVDCRITGFRGTNLLTLDAPEPAGIYADNRPVSVTEPIHLEVLRNTFADNGVSVWLEGDGTGDTDPTVLRTTFNVNDNTIVGNGPDSSGRQYGIRIWTGAGGEVKRNTITDHAYVGTAGPVQSRFSHAVLADGGPAKHQPMHFEANVFRSNQVQCVLIHADGSTIVNNSFEGTAPGRRPTGLVVTGENVLVATNHFSDLETGILLMGNDPDFGTSLGIASNAVLIANGFCNVATNITVEPLVTYSEQGTLPTCLQPSLSIRAILVSWPYWFNGYSVETAPSANGPWTASDTVIFPQNGQNNALIPMDVAQRFFRLQHP